MPSAASCGSSTSRTSAAPAALPAACSRPSKTAATTSCCWTTTSWSNPKASSGCSRSRTTASKPTIVGGHMFDLYNRSVLHTFGEVVNPYRIVPALPSADMETAARFQRRRTCARPPWLHRRVDVDYNGWWMCLIPTTVIREIGLSLPLFIKWDDAEYGLRAKDARLPHGLPARLGRLARVLDRQGRPRRLAGLLPRAQPARHDAAPQPVRARRPRAARIVSSGRQAPRVDAVLHRPRPRSRRCEDLLKGPDRPATRCSPPSCRKSTR